MQTEKLGCRRKSTTSKAATQGTVSYTHLDVYKRQLHYGADCRRDPGYRDDRRPDPDAVSYTHLELLNGSKERITEREYWAAKKGQLALDKENAEMCIRDSKGL